jgi:hypothetical protein
MVGMALAKSMYAIPTWTRTVRLVAEHTALQGALGCEGAPPSEWACYRFASKLRGHKHLLDACIGSVLDRLRDANPGMGENIAIDGSDLPAYANGQRYVSKGGRERGPEEYSDPDASWGHRSAVSTRKGGGFYGYKVHAAADTLTGLPVAWEVRTASEAETTVAPPLIDTARERGFVVKIAIADKGYDNGPFHDGCMERDVPDHAAPQHPRRRARRSPRPDLRARRVDVRRSRLQAQGNEVALPDRRMRSGFAVGQGRPDAPADPAPHGTVEHAVPQPWRGRARIRTAQE